MPLEEVPNFIEDPAGYDSRQLGPGWSIIFFPPGGTCPAKKWALFDWPNA